MSIESFITLWWVGTIGLTVVAYLIYRKTDEFKEYRFNNTTSGGVLEFKDYKQSKSFYASEHRWNYLLRLVGGFAGIGWFCIFVGLVMAK